MGRTKIPQKLKELRRWIVWKHEERGGKSTKVPYKANGEGRASTTDPKDWTTYSQARRAVTNKKMDGVGFVFAKGDGLVGLDYDGCFLEDGTLHPEVKADLEALNTYADLSPSERGVHAIVEAALPEGSKNRTKDTPWGGSFEVYAEGRYFTMTGQEIEESSGEVAEVDLREFLKDKFKKTPKESVEEDSPILRKLLEDGDWSDYESHSEADYVLIKELIKIHGPAPLDIFQTFKSSPLHRADKAGGDEYILRTIQAALQAEIGETVSESQFERDVEREVRRRKVRESAELQIQSERVPEGLGLPEPDWTLQDELAMPETERVWRIEGMHVAGGNVLLIAAFKSGKTALTLNLLRSVADGDPFLGRFKIEEAAGNIAVFNYEETPDQWRRHVRKLGIKNSHRIIPVHRRGQPILPIWEPHAQDQIVEWMIDNEITYWIMDPTAVAWQGLVDNENDNALAAAFTTALDQVKIRAGIGELLLTHHSGRLTEGVRGRGATRLEDWMDAGWYLRRDPDRQRYLSADGRDVEEDEFTLEWSEDKWQLSYGALVQDEKAAEGAEMVLVALAELRDQGTYPCSSTDLKRAMQGNNETKIRRIQQAVDNAWIKAYPDPENKARVLHKFQQLGETVWRRKFSE